MNNTRVRPLVSVVITVRNAEDYISATLASILQEQEIPLEVVMNFDPKQGVVDENCPVHSVSNLYLPGVQFSRPEDMLTQLYRSLLLPCD